MYWITSSLFSMGQIYLLKFPAIRTRLGIPELVKHPEEDKAKKEGEGFISTVKASKSKQSNTKTKLYCSTALKERGVAGNRTFR